MSMLSPIAAMLWENWRLTRVEAAQRFSLGIVLGAGALVLFDSGVIIAFWILISQYAMIWFSIAKLNGGRFMDGYKPGFPLYLLYTRPVSTAVFVGVAVAYDAISCVAMYLVSAALLGLAFGKALPLFSVALWLTTSHLAYACVQWSTRNRLVQWIGSMVFSVPMFFALKDHVTSSMQFEFSNGANVAMVIACLVSVGLTVAGVARQRRGDAVESVSRTAASGGYPDWLVNLFQFPCPVSSPKRAQVWFELKSSGLPVLTFGLAVAMIIPLLFAISIPFVPVRHAAVFVTTFGVPITVFLLGANAFAIRRKQGRTYVSAFEATQPYNTSQLAGLKLLVRTACLLTALVAIGVSVWASTLILSAWGTWVLDGGKDAVQGLLQLRGKVEGAFGGQTGYMHTAQTVVVSIVIAALVALLAAREALRARYPRLLYVVQAVPVVWGFAMILLTLATARGFGPEALVGAIVSATFWITGAAMAATTIYLLWSGFVERALTLRYAGGALAISVVFVAAWLAGMPAGGAPGILWLTLVVLMVSVLAPWSLNRIRHA